MSLESSARNRLLLAWGATLLALLGATWPLWTPWGEAPRLPAPYLGLAAPPLDLVCLPVLVFAVLATLLRDRSPNRMAGFATAALAVLMLGDQLRWQPWAYHALLVGFVLATCSAGRAVRLARWLAISVYAYSALWKFDATFAATLGQQFLATGVVWMGVDPAQWPADTSRCAAMLFPAAELFVACLLAAGLRYPKLAKPGAVVAVAMHAAVVAILSPWGLDHSTGVLLWNVGFAWQTWALFSSQKPHQESATRLTRLATAVIVFAMIAPASAPCGWWDRWPSWGLYSPGGERAAVFVHRSVWDRLPVGLQKVSEETDDAWRRARLDRWLLAENRAPIYPQNRVVLAIAAGLVEKFPLGDRVRVVAESQADHVTGERDTVTYDGTAEIRGAGRWLVMEQQVVWP